MNGLNRVTLIGRVGKDPEVKTGKVKYARFSLATSESYKDKTTGEWKELTEWHSITTFDKVADMVEKNIQKGSLLYVEGKLRTKKVEGTDGTVKYFTEIISGQIKVLTGRKVEEKPEPDYPETHNEVNSNGNTPTSNDDDLPF